MIVVSVTVLTTAVMPSREKRTSAAGQEVRAHDRHREAAATVRVRVRRDARDGRDRESAEEDVALVVGIAVDQRRGCRQEHDDGPPVTAHGRRRARPVRFTEEQLRAGSRRAERYAVAHVDVRSRRWCQLTARFVANDSNATTRPSLLSDGVLLLSFPSVPFVATLTRVVGGKRGDGCT